MKKNGVAVEMIPVHEWSGYVDRSGRNAVMSEYLPGDTHFETYVEASEYFELLEKYRCLKRRLAAKKRRDNRRKGFIGNEEYLTEYLEEKYNGGVRNDSF